MTEGLVSIRVQGLGSLADVTIEPGRLTVLIGPNGSGKSNLLRALKLAALLRTKSLQRFVGEAGGASALLHYGPKRTPAMTLELVFQQGDQRSEYAAKLGFAAGDRLLFLDESIRYDPDKVSAQVSALGAGYWESRLLPEHEDDSAGRAMDWWLAQLTFFHFHDTSINSALRTHARVSDDQGLHSNGGNLAAYLARLERGDTEADAIAWRRINQLVHAIAPSVKQLRPTISNESVRLDWIDDQDEVFGVHQMSDGTLRAVALVTALAQPEKELPRFICIDEPELGLHPAAITIVADLARSISRHCQVLFATQSPTFLDHFDPEEVVVVEREAGASTLHRLDASALQAWLDEYTLSEVFDKGILGGRP